MKKENSLIQVSDGWSSAGAFRNPLYNNRIFERIIAVSFLLIGIYAMICVVVNGYFEEASVADAFKLVAPPTVIFMLVLDMKNKIRLPILAIAAIIAGYFIYSNIKLISDIWQGAYYYVGKWIAWYVLGGSIEAPKNLVYITSHYISEMIAVICLPWILLLSIAWSRRGHIYSSISAITGYFIIFFCCGYMPDFIPFTLIILSGVSVGLKIPYAKIDKAFRDRLYIKNIRRELSFVVILLLAYLSYEAIYGDVRKVILPVQDYIYDGYSLEKVVIDEGNPGENLGATGGISGGHTGNGGVSFSPGGDLAFRITSRTGTKHYTYLKAYVADTYTGEGWVNRYDPAAQNWFYLDDQFAVLRNEYDSIRVVRENNKMGISGTNLEYFKLSDTFSITSISNDLKDGGYVLLPYAALIDKVDGVIQDGYYLKRKSGNTSYFDYYDTPGGFSPNAKDGFFDCFDWRLNTDNSPYVNLPLVKNKVDELENFAYKNYTEVPERLSRIKEDYSKYSFDTVREAVEFVQKELTYGFRYDKRPGKIPKGKDFIEYFMYESKAGYCMYYASAAVMMFRSMGIPARYVEGYLVPELSAQTVTDIKDTNAHAWAEIFVKGFGWIPVEVTNARLTTAGFIGNPPQSRPTEPHDTKETTSRKPSETTTKPTGSTSSASTSANKTSSSAADNGEVKDNPILKIFLIVIAVICSVAALGFAYTGLFYLIYGGQIKKSISCDGRERILRVYARIYRLTRKNKAITAEADIDELAKYWSLDIEKLKIFKEALMVAEYGNREITKQECAVAEKLEEKILMRKNKKAKGIGKLIALRKLRIRRKIYASK